MMRFLYTSSILSEDHCMFVAIYSTESSGDLRREFYTYDAACGFVDSQGSGCVLDTDDDYPVARYATHQWYYDCY